MFTSQSTIERRAAKEKRMAMVEERLSALENASPTTTIDLSPLETRLSSLESVKPVDLSSIEARLATLEGRPAPTVDFSPLNNRIAVLEAVKPMDLSEIESHLVALEKSCSTLEATLKTLTTNHGEGAADINKRLESAEANAAIVRKELDAMKAASKKPVGGGSSFATGGGSSFATAATKNFAFPAKKKEEVVDKNDEMD